LDYLGKYKVIEEIGRGRFSIVYHVEHPFLKKSMALKLMQPTIFDNSEKVQRFVQEIRTTLAMQHENVVQVVDLIEDGGRLFLVMEYSHGGDLQKWYYNHGKITSRHVTSILSQLAEGLDYIHSQGVVHGDVKPGNILISDDGNARLSDIGVLRAVEFSGSASSEICKPSPYYISPEEAEGGEATPLSDQYALGIVAYELFAGKVPFTGDTPLSIYLKHVREKPVPVSQINPLVSPQLDAVIQKVLAKDPKSRFPDCRAFAAALQQVSAVTEAKQIKDLIDRASSALASFDSETARPLVQLAMQIAPEDNQTRKLFELLEKTESANLNYSVASDSFSSARLRAITLRSKKNPPSDTQGLLERLAPLPLPALTILIQKFRFAFLFALATGMLGLMIGILSITYTSLLPPGQYQKATLVAYVRTSTPVPPTYTPTATLTPTPTITPTFPPTATDIPTLVVGSTLARIKDKAEMVYIPPGAFTMGSKEGQDDEKPVHSVLLAAFWIDQTEITNSRYAICVDDGVCKLPASNSSSTRSSYFDSLEFAQYPVINISWDQAKTYCEWAGGRLPSEAEWEKAARGLDERTYPWGEEIDKTFANFIGGVGDTAQVGSYKKGRSPYGVYDMAGNVWEWTSSLYKPYPYVASDGREDQKIDGARVLRGGSWYYHYDLARSSYRYSDIPSYSTVDIGFRCARNIVP